MKNLNKALALVMAVAMLLGMCSFAVAEQAPAYTESPVLAAKVQAGELPPVAERLPVAADVMVENEVGGETAAYEVGQYFNHFTLLQSGTSKWGPGKPTEEPLFRFRNDGTVEPNVAKGYDVNDDFTVWTVYLREGMKWSDGEPFTTEDVRFFYEDVLVPEVNGRSLWEALQVADAEGNKVRAEMTVIDDYSFSMTFVAPKPAFLQELAINGKWFFGPKHYLKDYIPGEGYLTAEECDAKAQELGYSDSAAMLEAMTYYFWVVPGRPTLRAWTINGDFDAELCIWERNPYYFKVDEAGQQLPYADEMHMQRISDGSQALMMTLDGTADVNSIGAGDLLTVLESDRHITEWSSPAWSSQSMQLNLAVQDEDKRPLYQNINFRHALSIAVNRQQIADIVDQGFTKPAQSAPGEGAQGYSEDWTNKWTEYDPAAAKALLENECGLVMGADGFYDFANGNDLVLNLQYNDEVHAQLAELLKNDFEAIGLKTTVRIYDRSILEEMRSSNTHEITLNYEHFETISLSLRPDYLIPFRAYCVWGTAFGTWYRDHNAPGAVEPTEDVKTLLNHYDEMMAATTIEGREAAAEKMLADLEAGIYEIGFTSAQTALTAISPKLHNFPEFAINCDEFRNIGIAHAACWWIEQ